MGSRISTVSQKNSTVMNRAQSQDSIGFSCTVLEIQNISHSRRISPWEVIRKRFHEKMQRSKTFREVARIVEFQSVFRAPSRKFKILAKTNVLANEKSYVYGLMKKRDGYTLREVALSVEF
ncbi:hypothetical protein B296_00046281 [Ensete ventricosum]|uniref:Uncharacterized protein n=1 Tax=Ensete ventricosum TaxID=4639 RepID=A0A426Z4C1_ENSVE|nr:hypothetical protein B296_00046281 [Ensete ventricosum]